MTINKWHKIATFFIVLALILAFISTDTFTLLINGQFEAIADTDGIWLVSLLTLCLMIIQNLFTVVPLILLITFNLTLYGFTYGYLWSLVTSIIGAVICFYAVRFWFQALLIKRLNQNMTQKVKQNAFAFVFIGRIFPFVPTSLVNIAAGISVMSLGQFVLSTLLGNLIYIFILALIVQGVMQIELELYVYVAVAVLFTLFYIVYRLRRKKRASID